MVNTMAKSPTHRYRRRFTSVPIMAASALVVCAGVLLLGPVCAGSKGTTEPLVPLDKAILTSNMRHWKTDYAVMFYAPWCNHCKESFMPLWQDVAVQLAQEDPRGKRNLVMGKFDCEQDAAAVSFCQEVDLKYYPTFMFFGAGKFHDHDPVTGVVLGPRPTEHDSSVKFPSTAMVYDEVMADWVKTMNLVSRSNRVMDKLNIFGGSAKASSEEGLVAEIEALERKNQQLQEAMAGSSTASGEETKLPYGHGDPYKELWLVSYAEEFDPVLSCVADMASQYCDIEGVKEQDPWCSTLESCRATDFVGDECWPSSCPLRSEGCEITSFCLTPELVETYVDIVRKLNESDEMAETGAAEGTDGNLGLFGTWPEGFGTEAGAEQAGEQVGASSGLPPFFGRRPAAASHGGGVDMAADERRETVGV